MLIYFHIDELNRDGVVASGLKMECARRGYKVIYGGRSSTRLLYYFHGIFDAIIFPRPHLIYDAFGDSWLDWASNFVTLAGESVGIIVKDDRVSAKTLLEREYFEGERKFIDRINAICLWGSRQRDSLLRLAPDVADKVHIVGHPRHDNRCLSSTVHSVRPMTIGIATRAVALNDYFGRSALEPFETLSSEKFLFEYLDPTTGEGVPCKRAGATPAESICAQAIDVGNTIKIIQMLNDAGYTVSLRVHPKEDVDGWRRLITKANCEVIIDDPQFPITNWLSRLEYVIGPPSTSFYDAVMLGVTPISICMIDSRREYFVNELWEDNNRLMKFIFKPTSIDQILEYIRKGRRLDFSNDVKLILKEEADFPECSNSLSRVVDVCEKLPSIHSEYSYAVRCSLLIIYIFAEFCYMSLWNGWCAIRGRRFNSAIFPLNHIKKTFINDLTVDQPVQ